MSESADEILFGSDAAIPSRRPSASKPPAASPANQPPATKAKPQVKAIPTHTTSRDRVGLLGFIAPAPILIAAAIALPQADWGAGLSAALLASLASPLAEALLGVFAASSLIAFTAAALMTILASRSFGKTELARVLLGLSALYIVGMLVVLPFVI